MKPSEQLIQNQIFDTQNDQIDTSTILKQYLLLINDEEERTQFQQKIFPLIVDKLSVIDDQITKKQILNYLLLNKYGFSIQILKQIPPTQWKQMHDREALDKHLMPQIYVSQIIKRPQIITHTREFLEKTQNLNRTKQYMQVLKQKIYTEDHFKYFIKIQQIIQKFKIEAKKEQIYDILPQTIKQTPIQKCHIQVGKQVIGMIFATQSRELTLEQIVAFVAQKSPKFISSSQKQITLEEIQQLYVSIKQPSCYSQYQAKQTGKILNYSKLKSQTENNSSNYIGQEHSKEKQHPRQQSKLSNQTIENWGQKDIQVWARLVKQKYINPNFKEIFAVVYRTAELINKFKPRHTQVMALLSLYKKSPNKGILAQINTGEGKSLIVAMLAAILALEHHLVDIVTTSSQLSEREVKKQQRFFALLSLTVGGNEDASEEHYKKDIIYGIGGNFQGDILRTEFMLQNIRTKRLFDVVIVDEVDSMLFDDRNYCTQLSQITSGVNHLDLLLSYIYQYAVLLKRQLILVKNKTFTISRPFVVNTEKKQLQINSTQRLQDIIKQVPNVIEYIKQQLRVYIKYITRTLTLEQERERDQFDFISNKIIQFNIISNYHESYISTDQYYLYETLEDYKNKKNRLTRPTTKQNLQQQIKKCENLLQEHPWRKKLPHVDIIPHLKQFVHSQTQKWIRNVVQSLFHFEKSKHYQVEEDFKIAPIDYANTGVVQQKMVWSDGLTQFLQLKQNVSLTSQSISTNFISSVSYFRRYTNLYGLTGTLGNQNNKNFFSQVYDCEIIIIPPYKLLQFQGKKTSSYICKELKGVVLNDEQKWYQKITEQSIFHAELGQGVLIICQFAKTVNKISQDLKIKYPHKQKIFIYTDQLHGKLHKQNIDSGQIIVATNIAGRGTDIKTSQSVEKSGGLHVCVTLLPQSLRVELQNVGRTSRQGKRGTAQLILYSKETQKIQQLFSNREISQKIAVKSAIEETNKMVFKDKLFHKFCQLSARIFPTENQQKKTKFQILQKLWSEYKFSFLTNEADIKAYIDYSITKQVLGDYSLEEGLIEQLEKQVTNLEETVAQFRDQHKVPEQIQNSLQQKNNQDLEYLNYFKTQLAQLKQMNQKYIQSINDPDVRQRHKKIYEQERKKKFQSKYSHHFNSDLFKLVFQNQTYQPTPQKLQYKSFMEGANWGEFQKRSIQQRWGFWMKSHLDDIHYQQLTESQQSTDSDSLTNKKQLSLKLDEQKYLKQFQKFQIQILSDAKKNKLIRNPYYYILKGNSRPQANFSYCNFERFQTADYCYKKAIQLSPKTSSNAYYNWAFQMLGRKENNRQYFGLARDYLKKAFFLIQKQDKPQIQGINVAISCNLQGDGKNPTTTLAKKILWRLKMKQKQQQFILIAISKIIQAQSKSKDCYVQLTEKSLKQGLVVCGKQNQLPNQQSKLLKQVISQSHANGLSKFYELSPKQPFDYWSAIAVIVLGALQITAGVICMIYTGGAFGQTLISEGVSDIYLGIKSMVTKQNIDWKQYGISKLISYSIAVVCFFWDKISSLNKGAEAVTNKATEAVTTKGFQSVATDTTKGTLNKALVQQIGQQVVKRAAYQFVKDLAGFFIDKAILSWLEQIIRQHVRQQLSEVLGQIKLIQIGIKVDNQYQTNNFQKIIIKKGQHEIRSNILNAEIRILFGIVQGVLKKQFKIFQQFKKAFDYASFIDKLTWMIKRFGNNLQERLEKDKLQFQINKFKNLNCQQEPQKGLSLNSAQQNFCKYQKKIRGYTTAPSCLSTIVDEFVPYFVEKITTDFKNLTSEPITNYTVQKLDKSFQIFNEQKKLIQQNYQTVVSFESLIQKPDTTQENTIKNSINENQSTLLNPDQNNQQKNDIFFNQNRNNNEKGLIVFKNVRSFDSINPSLKEKSTQQLGFDNTQKQDSSKTNISQSQPIQKLSLIGSSRKKLQANVNYYLNKIDLIKQQLQGSEGYKTLQPILNSKNSDFLKYKQQLRTLAFDSFPLVQKKVIQSNNEVMKFIEELNSITPEYKNSLNQKLKLFANYRKSNQTSLFKKDQLKSHPTNTSLYDPSSLKDLNKKGIQSVSQKSQVRCLTITRALDIPILDKINIGPICHSAVVMIQKNKFTIIQMTKDNKVIKTQYNQSFPITQEQLQSGVQFKQNNYTWKIKDKIQAQHIKPEDVQIFFNIMQKKGDSNSYNFFPYNSHNLLQSALSEIGLTNKGSELRKQYDSIYSNYQKYQGEILNDPSNRASSEKISDLLKKSKQIRKSYLNQQIRKNSEKNKQTLEQARRKYA